MDMLSGVADGIDVSSLNICVRGRHRMHWDGVGPGTASRTEGSGTEDWLMDPIFHTAADVVQSFRALPPSGTLESAQPSNWK